jgi:tetratricopeptide (TPR) repeat protein
MAYDVAAGDRERPFVGVTGEFARFFQRIGEEDKAAAILDHLIERLQGVGLHANRRAWASYLFDRASIAMDQRDAELARRRLQEYVTHYDNLLRDVRQNPEAYVDPELAQRYFASQLAAGHISLAVLHNVVLHDVATAREHCRKAYALEDSPFNRVLYACYLARDGNDDEARALLATVDATPPLYYNLACTHALCGEGDKALAYLALDLKLNHPTRKARNRQRDWALKDRDFASLIADPRFLELVRPRAEGEER